MEKGFAAFFLAFSIIMMVLYGIGTEYVLPSPIDPSFGGSLAQTAIYQVHARYPFFQDVHVMIFIGFGFLMSFLHRGGFTATGHAFLVACYSVLWAILNRGFWERAVHNAGWERIALTTTSFVGADFCAGAILISFGAMLGRVTASQLLVMAIIEVIIYSINESILVIKYGTADIGGSMVIHTFGAYFGLTCSFVLEKINSKRNLVPNLAGSTRVTDTMAMVGTLFLFCFWPSFNAALAGQSSQDRAAVNTLLSIMTSAIFTFFVCCLVDPKGRFGMVEIQNSTIAGGVAMGAAADMVVNPVGAMIVGATAGIISVCGYRFLTPLLERAGLRDTCGIHNLHGMPGILGAIVSAIAAGAAREGSYHNTFGEVFYGPRRSHSTNAGYQMAGLGTTLAFALVGGAITGAILAAMPTLPAFFDDVYEYIVPEEHGTETTTIQQSTNEPVEGAGTEMVTTTTTHTIVTGNAGPYNNAPSATEHGAAVYPAEPVVKP
jgi:ammonium transporter Rh